MPHHATVMSFIKLMNKYISKYSNNKEVSAAQYITEIICEHYAKKHKLDLHFRFWTHKDWASYYRNQIGTANKLIQKYDCRAIIRALNNPQSAKIYSLRAPHLVSIIECEQEKLQSENTNLHSNYQRKTDSKYITGKTKKNIISKLKDIE
jgi:hypothetical protein